MAKLAFLYILLICYMSDKSLSMVAPKFLAFVFISIVVFAYVKAYVKDTWILSFFKPGNPHDWMPIWFKPQCVLLAESANHFYGFLITFLTWFDCLVRGICICIWHILTAITLGGLKQYTELKRNNQEKQYVN